jgi:hypothetical protein
MSTRDPSRDRVINIVAVAIAAAVVIAVTATGLVVGAPPPPTPSELAAGVRFQPVVAQDLLLTPTEQETLFAEEDIEVTEVRTNVSSPVIPDTVLPEECVGTIGIPRVRGTMSIGATGIEDATVSLESSVIVFATPDDAEASFREFTELRADACSMYAYDLVLTSLSAIIETDLGDIEVAEGGYSYVDATTMLTYSDGFIQRGGLRKYLVGNAVFSVIWGLNQPLVDAPWGEVAIDRFTERLDEYVADATSASSAG